MKRILIMATLILAGCKPSYQEMKAEKEHLLQRRVILEAELSMKDIGYLAEREYKPSTPELKELKGQIDAIDARLKKLYEIP